MNQIIKKIFELHIHILLVYVLLVFPMFYFVYKFAVLSQGYDDARSYLKLFEDLSSKDVPSPFNMRLLTSSCIHLMEKIGFVYNTECSMDSNGLINQVFVNKRFFFNNVLFNFICVSLTSFSLYVIFLKLKFSKFLSFLSGVLFLLGFGTIFYLMMPGVDSLSVLIFTWIVYFYIEKSYWIIPLFLLLIFQREYYFLVFMVVALMDFFKNNKDKYYLHVLVTAIASFGIYYILRKTIFYTPHWNRQTSPAFLLGSIFEIKINVVSMIRQTLMTMNIYFIYLLVLLYKKHKGLEISTHFLYITLAVLCQITFLSFAAQFGNNNGRYFCLDVPLILYYIMYELGSFVRIEIATKN